MKLTKALPLLLILQSLAGICFGQQNLVYNHYFVNPYLYNPSYLAHNGHTELYLNYRKSWGDFKTATVNFQHPINYKVGIGASFNNDQAGIYTTNTGYLSFSYFVHFGQNFSKINRLGFGLSGGFTSSKLDLTKVSNPDDPAYTNTSVAGVQGQFGLNYQFQNFRIGFALPQLMKPRVVTSADLNSFSPFESTIATASYNFQLSPRVSLEPYALYRTQKNMPSQAEGMVVLRIDQLAWIGAAYRQEYGAAAFLGLNLKDRIKVGYAYEFAPNQVTGIGGGSHEVQLVVRLSKKKKERPVPVVEKVTGEVVEDEDPEAAEVKTDSLAQETVTENAKDPSQPGEKADPVKPQPTEEKPVEEGEQPTGGAERPLPTQQQPTEDVTKQADPTIVPTNETPVEKRPETKPVTKTLDGEALPPGHYVVVGAFRSVQNAKSFTRTLKNAGYPASVAFNPEKGYYIVHMGVTPSLEEAHRLRDVYRQKSRYSFKDTWILSIE